MLAAALPSSLLRDECHLSVRTDARQRAGGSSAYSRDVNAEFNYWLLIVGLVVGAGLVWLVVADSRRREVDVTELEREGEAQWIAAAMADAGRDVDEIDVLDILGLHAAYLAAAPPDESFGDMGGEPAADGERVGGAGRAAGRRPTDERTVSDERRWVAVPEATAGSEPTVNRR